MPQVIVTLICGVIEEQIADALQARVEKYLSSSLYRCHVTLGKLLDHQGASGTSCSLPLEGYVIGKILNQLLTITIIYLKSSFTAETLNLATPGGHKF